MKTPHCFRVIVWLSLLLFPSAAWSQTNLVWDPNGLTSGTGGNGNWTASGEWLNPGPPAAYQNWAAGANAVFSGNHGTVTLNSTITAAGLGFDVSGYTITGTGTITLNHPTGDERIAATTGTTVLDVILAGTSGFSKSGAGTVVLQKSNTVTGTIVISEGTLRLSGGAAIADAAAVSITASALGSSLDLNGTSETIGSLAGTGGTVALGSGVLTTGGNHGTTTFSGAVGGTGGLVKTGSGGFTLGGSGGTRSYDLTVDSGWVTLAHGGTATCDANAAITVNAGTLNVDGDLTLDNTTLTLAATGSLHILSGKTLTIQNGADASLDGEWLLETPATVNVAGSGSTLTAIPFLIFAGGSNLNVSGGGLVTSYYNWYGTTTGNGSATVDGAGSSLSVLMGTSLGWLGRTGGLVVRNGATSSLADLYLAGDETAGTTGTLLIESGAQVTTGNIEAAIGNAATSGTITVTGSGSVLTQSGTSTLTLGGGNASTATLNVNSGGVFNGGTGLATIQPTGTLSVNGGTARLGGALNHFGEIQIANGGLVDVRAACANLGTIATDAGGILRVVGELGGGGSFTGPGFIHCLGSLNPGPGAATTSFGGHLILGGNHNTIMHLGGTQRGTHYDAIKVSGHLAVGGKLTLRLINGFQPQAGDSFDLFDWGGLSGRFYQIDLPPLAEFLSWDGSRLYSAGVLSVVTGSARWRQIHFGTAINFGDAASTADPDNDGFINLLEYAFGLSPHQNSALWAPKWQRNGNTLVCSFTEGVYVVSDITYGAEWSTTMTPGSWQPLADTGTPPQHTFTLPMNGGPRRFVRLKVTSNEPTPPPGTERFALIHDLDFLMGDQSNPQVGYSNELPVHRVFVDGMFMGKYEVTKEEWDAVRAWAVNNGYTDLAAGNGSFASKGANHPVHSISWYDTLKWCNARSQRDGLTPCYTVGGAVYKTGQSEPECNWLANGYRLPTEAEWEKAARAIFDALNFPWGDTISHSQANYMVLSIDGTTNYYSYDVTPRPPGLVTEYHHPTYATGDLPYTSPVGSFAKNGYGLYDMTGNLWEWCWDWYLSDYYDWSPDTDPRGPSSGSGRVIRGGSYSTVASYCRSATRGSTPPSDTGNYGLGFRVVRSAVP